MLDRHAANGGAVARRTGRSWWSLRYTDGRILSEWEADPGSPNGHQDWPRLAMLGKLRGVQSLRLFCPNGQMAQLEAPGGGDATGRLFQFKLAARHVRLDQPGQVPEREILAHGVGVVHGLNGQCTLFAWEPLPAPQPPGGPKEPTAPNYFNREQPLWALKEQDARYRADLAAFEAFLRSPAVALWQQQHRVWQQSAGGRLVGPLEDNVYAMRYQSIGRLNAEVLGIADGAAR